MAGALGNETQRIDCRYESNLLDVDSLLQFLVELFRVPKIEHDVYTRHQGSPLALVNEQIPLNVGRRGRVCIPECGLLLLRKLKWLKHGFSSQHGYYSSRFHISASYLLSPNQETCW